MIFQKIKYYDNIEILPLYNFDKYRSTKDLNWFIVGYDGRQKKLNNEKLKEIETSIIDQYFKEIDDATFLSRLKKWGEIDILKSKYVVIKALVSTMLALISSNNEDMELRLNLIKSLKKHGYSMPEINTIEGDIESLMIIDSGVEGVKTQIHLIEKELVITEKKKASLHSQLRLLEIGLGYNYRLNEKQITVSEWIAECKLLEEKNTQNNNIKK
jgi:hypothetical protein